MCICVLHSLLYKCMNLYIVFDNQLCHCFMAVNEKEINREKTGVMRSMKLDSHWLRQLSIKQVLRPLNTEVPPPHCRNMADIKVWRKKGEQTNMEEIC